MPFDTSSTFFLRMEKIRNKDVSFVVHGQDIVIRHIETPIMYRKGIWKTLQWEVSQYLLDGGKDYYFDFEITDKINNRGVNGYMVMVVSVPKKQVERYMELTCRNDL